MNIQKRSAMNAVRDAGKFKEKHRVKAHTIHARQWFSDPYFTLLEATWSQLLLAVISGYASVITFAWLLTLVDSTNVAGEPEEASSMLRAFMFAATNVVTMGFGSLYCESIYLYWIATLQQCKLSGYRSRRGGGRKNAEKKALDIFLFCFLLNGDDESCYLFRACMVLKLSTYQGPTHDNAKIE